MGWEHGILARKVRSNTNDIDPAPVLGDAVECGISAFPIDPVPSHG